jgi:hypothetical protein
VHRIRDVVVNAIAPDEPVDCREIMMVPRRDVILSTERGSLCLLVWAFLFVWAAAHAVNAARNATTATVFCIMPPESW